MAYDRQLHLWLDLDAPCFKSDKPRFLEIARLLLKAASSATRGRINGPIEDDEGNVVGGMATNRVPRTPKGDPSVRDQVVGKARGQPGDS